MSKRITEAELAAATQAAADFLALVDDEAPTDFALTTHRLVIEVRRLRGLIVAWGECHDAYAAMEPESPAEEALDNEAEAIRAETGKQGEG